MSNAGRRALVDEFERNMLEFADFIQDFTDDFLDVAVPGEEGSIRKILGHVVSAGYGHIIYVAKAAGGVTPEAKFKDPDNLADAKTYVAALLDVNRFANEALAHVNDDALGKRFTTRWGQEFDGEQMLEHAACHPPRHARQIRRFLDGTLGT